MPIELQVAPPGITISQGRTFMVTSQNGGITQHSEEGVYAIDTRFISAYRLYINNQPWTLINSSQLSFYASRTHLTNPLLSTEDGDIEAHTLDFALNRAVGKGIHEDFDIANYTNKTIRFVLALALRSDFADLFEVKAKRIIQRGRVRTHWNEHELRLHTSYDNKDFHRAITYQVLNTTSHVSYGNGRIIFDIELAPKQKWHACGEIILEHGQHVRKPVYAPCGRAQAVMASEGNTPPPGEEPLSDFDQRQAHWQANCTDISTTNRHVNHMYNQAVEDMGALRIYDLDVSEEAWVPAAGVPWFVTLFGRDSLIVSLQNMSVSTGFARGALKRLSEYQAQECDNWRDAQPGKILHEIRFGELAHFHSIPFTPYYGTADATPLYLIALSEAYRWTGDQHLLQEYHQVAEGCLQWIDRYGDLDGDGFQEYKTFSSSGYENMGWKDAGDAVVYSDGTQVKQPKALCELQGYVYDAKVRMAEIFEALGQPERAQAVLEQAEELKTRFNQAFWMEDEGCFAFGLDPEKKQITTVASNAGHCLWSGIADQDKAEKTAKRLLQKDMWSGWGIRTVSSNNPAYNPFSYHLGSVWPHDNGIIAAGIKRYGMMKEANTVIRGVFDASRRFQAYRLPEIYAGLRREGKIADFPALYPGGANIPQAWASGAIFHMLQTILGLRADAPNGALYVCPTLPPWLSTIQIRRLRVGGCSIDMRFWREGNHSRWEVYDVVPDEKHPPQRLIKVFNDPEVPILNA